MKQWAGRVVSAVAVAALGLTGCGTFFIYPGNLPGGGSSGTGDYVYVANATAGTVAAYAVGTNTLTAVSGSPFSLGFTANAIAINPADTILFVSGISGASGIIKTYSIASSGVLSLLQTYNLGTTVENAIAVSPNGDFLLGLEANGSTTGVVSVDKFSITASSGALTAQTGAIYSFASGAAIDRRAVTFSPNEQLVFVALGTAGDLVFPFPASNTAWGSAALLSPPSTANADDALTVSPNGSYLYVARTNSTSNGVVAAYTITGLTVSPAVGPPTVSAGVQPYSVVINGTNVYVANQSGGNISGYSGAATGVLTALSLSPYSTTSPTALAIDQSGKYLLAISNGGGGNNLNMYSFDSSGNLVASTSANAGSGPIALAATH